MGKYSISEVKGEKSAFRYVFVSYCSLVSDTILQVSD